jgi:uncharacterized protein DUF6163
MARAQPTRQAFTTAEEAGDDRLKERPAGEPRLRWTVILTWFMRILSILWIIKGLSAWALILGIWAPSGLFETRTLGYQATIIYFAVIDVIAAVGLWMASTWGGVLWLLAIMSHLILAAFFPRIVSGSTVTIVFFSCFIVTYLVVSWLSAREE